jgi:hypothetical protein
MSWRLHDFNRLLSWSCRSSSPRNTTEDSRFFTSTRSDLLRVISNWEMSGQGDGGRENKDGSTVDENSSSMSIDIEDELPPTSMGGNLCNRPPRALDNRAALLNGRPSYLLYFWEVADTHQLLASSLQRLSNNAGVSSSLSQTSSSNHTWTYQCHTRRPDNLSWRAYDSK